MSRPRLPGSLRGRLTLAAVAAVALVGALAGLGLLAAVERDGRRAVDSDLRSRATDLTREALRPGRFGRGPRGGRPGPGPDDRALLAGSGTFVQVAVGGEIVARRGDVPAEVRPVPAADGLRTVELDGAPWRSFAFGAGPAGDVRVQVLQSLAPVEDRVAGVRGLVLGLGLLALLGTGAAAWGLSSLAVRPLGRLRAGAARVSAAQDLGAPLPEDEGPDEVRSLARALNEMLARLRASSEATERALEATSRFAADAGHELRTPLTGLRANLEALERNPGLPVAERAELVRETLAEQERMVHLLEGLQALARGEAAERLPREDVDLGELLDAALYAAGRRHPGTTFELGEEGAELEGGRVEGWAGGLRLLVDNLLDNAALHGRPGGRVRAGVWRDAGAALVIRVSDDGPGIPPGERERLLEPFARGGSVQAPGTGLGLAIVAQQAALHGGALTLGDSALGGLAAEVVLPALEEAPRAPALQR